MSIAPDRPTPRCLLVTKEFAARPTSGGTLRTLALMEQLATRYDTTVVSPEGVFGAGPGRPLERRPIGAGGPGGAGGGGAGVLRRVQVAPRYRSISGVRTAGPALLDNLWSGAEGRYDAGVVDHTVLAGLADDIATGCDRLVVSMHNIESDLMAQRAAVATGPAQRVVMRAETQLLRRLEAHVVTRYPVVVCTEADARALGATGPEGPGAIVCRNGIFAGPSAQAAARPPHSMVFSGALDWEPNTAGLHWFVEQVWPAVRRQVPTATVTIAGRHPGADVVRACSGPGLTLLANPPVMATVLAAHGLGIVPLLSGGGSRIKILEYLAAGLDVVSTDVGASGLEDISDDLVERTPVDPGRFAESLVRRLQDPRDTSVLAQIWVREHYSWEVTLRPLLDFLLAGASSRASAG